MEKKGKAKKRELEKECSGDVTNPKLKQLRMDDLNEVRPENVGKDKISEAVVQYIVGCSTPFTVVEHPDFINLLKVTGVKHVPNRKQVMDKLESSFKAMKESLKEDLQNVSYVCTTADCWTVFKR